MTAAEARRPERRLRTRLSSIAPGLLAAASIAVLARFLAGYLPSSIADVSVALLLGIVVGQAAGSGASSLAAGTSVAAQILLRAGIVLLGARLSLDQVVAIGLPAALIVVITMTIVFTAVLALARVARVEATLAVLLAVGIAVCGNSAIIATAPVLGAKAREVAYAVATITLFGTLAVFLYPVIGHLLGMRDPAFGLWSGVAVNDTSQVVAASSSYSPDALEIATVVKLIRNALMAPLLILIAWGWTRRTGSERRLVAGLRRAVPVFVLGFVALAGLRTAGLIQPALASNLDVVARWLILTALAGVGLSIRAGDLRAVGPRPLGVGLGAALAAGAATVTAIIALDLGSTIHP